MVKVKWPLLVRFLQTSSFSLYKTLIIGLESLLLDYFDVFISCLNAHSDGTPFTAEDQFVSNDVKFLKIRSDDPQVIQDEHEFEYIFCKSP